MLQPVLFILVKTGNNPSVQPEGTSLATQKDGCPLTGLSHSYLSGKTATMSIHGKHASELRLVGKQHKVLGTH